MCFCATCQANRRKHQKGQTLVEYAILAGLLALVTIGALHLMGEGMRETLQYIADELQKPL